MTNQITGPECPAENKNNFFKFWLSFDKRVELDLRLANAFMALDNIIHPLNNGKIKSIPLRSDLER